MIRLARTFGIALAVLAIMGCNARTDKTGGGGVLLSIQDFGTLPLIISASAGYAAGAEQIDSITVQSVVKNPDQGTSDLMKVELDSYQVTYTREDTGSRVPPRLVEYIFGSVDPGGSYVLQNGPYMRLDQLNNQPLKDLRELGIDPETGSQVIRLKVGIQFFGRTISGQSVQSNIAYFSLEVTP